MRGSMEGLASATVNLTAPLEDLPENLQESLDSLNAFAEAAGTAREEAAAAFIAAGTSMMPSEAILAEWDRVMLEIDLRAAEIEAREEALREREEEGGLDPVSMEELKSEQLLDIISRRVQTEIDIEDAKNELISRKTHDFITGLTRENADYWTTIKGMWKAGTTGQLQAIAHTASRTGEILSHFTGLMDQESRTLFNIGKTAAIAQATVDTIAGANAAYNSAQWLPWPANLIVGAATAAAVAAAGALNVSRIAGTSYGGGGGGAGAAGAGVPGMGSIPGMTTGLPGMGGAGQGVTGIPTESGEEEEAAPRSKEVSISLVGSMFSPEQVRELIGALNEQLDDGARLSLHTTTGEF
jgi:hypothetical protein